MHLPSLGYSCVDEVAGTNVAAIAREKKCSLLDFTLQLHLDLQSPESEFARASKE